MLTKAMIVNRILKNKKTSMLKIANAFAPSNIALAKYWGKRDQALNLPVNSSLSISLKDKGAIAKINLTHHHHLIHINNKKIDQSSTHAKKITNFLDLFKSYYSLNLEVNLPFAAGLASSACIFAAITLALNKLHQWNLSTKELSILARLGSGSACRSIENGFVLWQMGDQPDGMDSFAIKLDHEWRELCIGLLIFDKQIKPVSSREGMQRTKSTSPLYTAWPLAAKRAVETLTHAIEEKNFLHLAQVAEQNALCMHATMMSAWPPLLYSTEQTLQTIKKIWALRSQGLDLYFTQDAGANIKLIFLENETENIKHAFKTVEIIKPFA